MIIDRVFTPGLAQVAYLVADEASGDVAVIDPRRDVDAVVCPRPIGARLRASPPSSRPRPRRFRLRRAELTARPARRSTPAGRAAARSATPLADAEVGRAVPSRCTRRLERLADTPEHLAFLLIDPAQGKEPVALFWATSFSSARSVGPICSGPARSRTSPPSSTTPSWTGSSDCPTT